MTYPTIRPELTLDFANSRQLDPRITFSRSSGATYLNPDTGLITLASDHEARFEKEGLLIEESRTNFFTYSVDLSQQWTEFQCDFTPNTTVAPDGTITATTITEDTSNDSHLVSGYTGVPQNGSGTHTFSVFAKAKERSVIALSANESLGGHYAVATFDLQAGEISQSGDDSDPVDYVDSSIVDVGNGWYRCSLTYTNTNNVWPNLEIANTPTYSYTNLGRCNYQGDGTSGIYVWGVQMERFSSFPTSYIPTAGSTVIRSADIAQITGDNFSSWYNQSEGTFTIDLPTPLTSIGNNDIIFSTNAGLSGTENVLLQWVGTPYWKASSAQVATAPVKGSDAVTGKYAMAWDSSTIGAATDGYAAVTTTSGTVLTTATALNIFTGGNGSRPVYGHISRIAYYNERLTDAELQTLTS